MTDNITNLIGMGIGLGVGIYTLRALENLNPNQRSEINKILSFSRRVKNYEGKFEYEVEVKHIHLNKARNALKRSGFTIVNQYVKSPNTTLVVFKEKIKP